jgi:hypothetical protein
MPQALTVNLLSMTMFMLHNSFQITMRTVKYFSTDKFDTSQWFSKEAYIIRPNELLIIVLDIVHTEQVLKWCNNQLLRRSREEHTCVIVRNTSQDHEVQVDAKCSFDELLRLSEVTANICRIKFKDLLDLKNK